MPSLTIERKDLSYLTFNVEFKALTGDLFPNGGVSGHASTTGNTDRVGDIVQEGAYDATIAQLIKDGFLAQNHDWDDPMGWIVTAKADAVGLYFEAAYHSTPSAQNLRTWVTERMAAGKTVSVSIGYKAEKWSYDADYNRILEAITIYEISIVTVPANALATVSESKDGTHGVSFLSEATEALGAVKSLFERAEAIEVKRAEKGGHIGHEALQILNEIKSVCVQATVWIDDPVVETDEVVTDVDDTTTTESTVSTVDANEISAALNALDAAIEAVL